MTGQQVTVESPLILLDSGSSRSVCGVSWLKWRYGGNDSELKKIDRPFRFGDGPLIHSSGTIIIFIHVDENCSYSAKHAALPVFSDVVGEMRRC